MTTNEAIKSIKQRQSKEIGKESQCGGCLSDGSGLYCEGCWCKTCTPESTNKECEMECHG